MVHPNPVLLAARRVPEQCPSIVSLLSESYNPHVRYGAAMALGIACAGTGMKVSCPLNRDADVPLSSQTNTSLHALSGGHQPSGADDQRPRELRPPGGCRCSSRPYGGFEIPYLLLSVRVRLLALVARIAVDFPANVP